MAFSNNLTRILDKFALLPDGAKWRAFSFVFGKIVPYVSTSGVRIVSVDEGRAEVVIPNRRKARNHVGGVHAAAVALLAETCSGLLVGRNVMDTALPLIRNMNLDFVRRNHGDFKAVATLNADEIEALQTSTKGQVTVPVTLTDASGEEPVTCEMIWAWVPKRK